MTSDGDIHEATAKRAQVRRAVVVAVVMCTTLATGCSRQDEILFYGEQAPTEHETGGSDTTFFFHYHSFEGPGPETSQRLLITNNRQHETYTFGGPGTDREEYWEEEYVIDNDVVAEIEHELAARGFFAWKSIPLPGADWAEVNIVVCASGRRHCVRLDRRLAVVDEAWRADRDSRVPDARDSEPTKAAKRFFNLIDDVRQIAAARGTRIKRGPFY